MPAPAVPIHGGGMHWKSCAYRVSWNRYITIQGGRSGSEKWTGAETPGLTGRLPKNCISMLKVKERDSGHPRLLVLEVVGVPAFSLAFCPLRRK